MSTKKLDGIALRNMLLSGYANLENDKDRINALNVFPVPDGDTGINMSKTLEGGIAAPEGENAAEYIKTFSKKSLLTARGNSGVIFSQFIRGLAAGCEGKDSVSVSDFAEAFNKGVECAYSSVIKPVEGTMLTVLKDTGEFLSENCNSFSDFEECFDALCKRAEASLDHTPELLPILKEAGVVDSGGAGLLSVFTGMRSALLGESITVGDGAKADAAPSVSLDLGPDFDFEFGYCTEFILQLLNSKCDVASFDIAPLSDSLTAIGDSVVAVHDGDIVKIHVHTRTPEAAIAEARRYGELITVKIENMSVQHSENTAAPKKKEKYAVVAVTKGDGIRKYFSEIGVNAFVDGGQTNNPSTEDFIKTFKGVSAEHIIVLPNNSNIILTARQAAEMYKDADVRVVPTRSYAECYTALSMMDLTAESADGLADSMMQYLPYVTSGYVTTATRNATIGGIELSEGDYIGLDNDSIRSCEKDKVSCALSLFKALPDIDDKAVITVFYGNDVTKEELSLLRSRISKELPLIEAGYIYGGQDVYSFIFAIE